MSFSRSLSFRVVMTTRIAAIVLALTAAFLWFVLGRAQERIEETGVENFRSLAQNAFAKVDALTQSHLQYLDTLGKLVPQIADLQSQEAVLALAESFLAHANANALAITRPDGTMLYFLGHDAEAPPGSLYTIGWIHPQADGSHLIEAAYYAVNHSVIARRVSRSTLRDILKSEWHRSALQLGGPYRSPPHLIPGWGKLGVSLVVPTQGSTIKLVTPFDEVNQQLRGLGISAKSAALLLDDHQHLVAFHAPGAQWQKLQTANLHLTTIAELNDPTLAAAVQATEHLTENQVGLVSLQGEPFLLAWHDAAKTFGTRYRVLLLAPLSDLSQVAEKARYEGWLIALVGLAILLPLSWYGAGAIADVLQQLAERAQRIAQLDFARPSQIHSSVREVQALVQTQDVMRNALAGHAQALQRTSEHLARLISIGVKLGKEKDKQALLDAMLTAAREMTGAQAGMVYLCSDSDMLCPSATHGLPHPERLPPLDMKLPELQRRSLTVSTVRSGLTVIIDDMERDAREELQGFRQFGDAFGLKVRSVVSIPLRTPDQRAVGVMLALNPCDPETGEVAQFSVAQISYLEALAAQAAVALDNQQLIASQTRLLDTLVRTLGDAVDAKSAYTGRHCARVPELAVMLAKEAHAADSGPLADFAFRSEDEWLEFRTGAWLHDCGKITSPEHVMDKATKLETVYNRLHEIRTRFEVLLRDARIEALEAQIEGRLDPTAAGSHYGARAQTLQDDYAFIASCNLGSEKMAEDDIGRVRAIGQQMWTRHFDDRLGISYEELERRRTAGETSLPVSEPLLADQPWQRISRPEDQRHLLSEGFRMEVPELLYNHGELYNLCVDHGTLTHEERFKINEHIIHTIRMLEAAHFPAYLRRVPEYAGTHHETLDGRGYPRGLTAAELSIPARIMAIADIFEALTASDRPYKPAKPLSESLAILQRMKKKGKIDPDLFDLFVRKEVYLSYAQRFLAPEQMDVTDVAPYLS